MAKNQVVITTNTTTLLCTARKPRNVDYYMSTINIFGTFGGTTVALQMSSDGGTTKVPMKNLSGTPITSTAADNYNINLGTGGRIDDCIQVYVVTTAGAGASITVTSHDNLG